VLFRSMYVSVCGMCGCVCVWCGVCGIVRDLFDGPITRAGKSYRCDVSECDREASILRRPRPTRGCGATKKISSFLFLNERL
jgi:hypothetical protein